jgi:hypothetical protein
VQHTQSAYYGSTGFHPGQLQTEDAKERKKTTVPAQTRSKTMMALGRITQLKLHMVDNTFAVMQGEWIFLLAKQPCGKCMRISRRKIRQRIRKQDHQHHR